MAAQDVDRRCDDEDDGRGEVGREAAVRSAAAFTAVFREHHEACLRLARRVVQDEGMAHDVVQDVFLSWWRSDGGGYRPDRGELATWLSTLTHHKAVDAVRTAERHRRLLTASAAEVVREEQLLEEVVWWELGRQALLTALPRLTAKQREVLSLAYGGGLTQVEIAEQLGIPLGTVKSRTHAGLLRLRAAMSGTWTPTGPAAEPASGPALRASAALLGVAWAATEDAVTPAVAACVVEVTRLAGATAPDRSGAAIVERAQALVAEHGEAALYALVVALARSATALEASSVALEDGVPARRGQQRLRHEGEAAVGAGP